MGKFYESRSTFNFTIDQVLRAFWSRYPNPFSTHVLSEDTLLREMRGDQLYSRRLITKTNRLPRLGHLFVKSVNKAGDATVSVVEESYIDPVAKTITTYTRNISYTRVMSVVEKVTYSLDPQNPSQTVALRSAWIESGIYGFAKAIEAIGVERFKKSAAQAVNGFNWTLNKIYNPENLGIVSGLRFGLLPFSGGSRLLGATVIVRQKAKLAGEMAKESIRPVPVYAAPSTPEKDPGK